MDIKKKFFSFIEGKSGLSIIKIIVGLLLIFGSLVSGYFYFSSKNGEQDAEEQVIAKEVSVISLDGTGEASTFIEAPGSIRAETKIDVPAMAGGTIRGMFFNVGDTVVRNQLLASVYDSAVLTNLNTASANVSNLRVSLLNTERIADQSIRQAELGVQSAREQVEAAEISLASANPSAILAELSFIFEVSGSRAASWS
jgi:multidrug efflux pump subunit AcrA (membrane-fusion protein)